jgi:hypothetical protein
MSDPTIFSDVAEYIRLSKDALGIFKTAFELLPKGQKRDEIERSVSAAEQALKRSDVALAQKLHFNLCQCTWPPQIMLWHNNEKAIVCPRQECGYRIQTGTADNYTSEYDPYWDEEGRPRR